MQEEWLRLLLFAIYKCIHKSIYELSSFLSLYFLTYLTMITTDTFPVLTEKTLQIECTVSFLPWPERWCDRLTEKDTVESISFGITVYMNWQIKKTSVVSWISKEGVRDTITWLLRMFSDFDYTNIREDSKRWNDVLDNLYNKLCMKRKEETELPINE